MTIVSAPPGRTRRDDDDASRGCTDSRHSRQCSLRAIRRERRADAGRRPSRRLSSSPSPSLALLFSPALKSQTTGAPPPSPLPPPHPPLPARLANCLEVPRTLGALPYKPSPHDTRLRAQRPDNRRSGILHRAPPPLEESLYYTTDHIPPAPRCSLAQHTSPSRRSSLASTLVSVASHKHIRSSRDSKFK